MKKFFISLVFIWYFFAPAMVRAQEAPGSDELFKMARSAAFDEKNYPKAIELAKKALVISPNYMDIYTFMGRLYNWSDKTDSARIQFNYVLSKEPDNSEALSAYFDLEYQRDKFTRALELAETGLKTNPDSEDFIIRKAKALNAVGRATDALKITSDYISKFPGSQPAIDLHKSIKQSNLYNNIGAGYSFVYFDKRFSDPWHLSYISYGTKTKYGSINFILNYANRFRSNATEFEIESYPRIANGLYAYLGGGTQLSGSLYPKYRIGLSLYKSLPFGFEIEGGIRHLQFATTTDVFIAGLLKYSGNSYFNLRSYLTPSGGKLSKSVNLIVRSFLSDDRNDYIGASIGTGLSPDERATGIFEPNSLRSLRASFDYSRNITRQTSFGVSLNYANEEYRAATFGNQYTINGSITRRF